MKKPTKRTSRSQVYLSKSKLMNYLQCTRQLWLKKHIEQEGDEDPVAEFHFDIGNRVGEIARSYFPKGVLINSKTEGVTLSESLKQTRQELQRKRRRPIFEATFEYDGVLVQVDLLIPGRGGVWKLVEVKSSHSAKKHYYPDIAIQRHVVMSRFI